MLSEPYHLPPVPRLLEVHEVAYYLKCSQESVRRLIREGKLPAYRPFGRSLRLKLQDVDALLEARRVLAQVIASTERALDRRLDEATDRVRALKTPA
jgi:excisionase family DNA binding protein